jgi:competence protein ComEC
VSFEVMHPSVESYGVAEIKDNDRGCVVKISNHYHQALLATDIERPSEAALVASQSDALAATVLVAPHHGSKTSSTIPFLSAVHPQIAIFSAGYLNRFHHPNPEIVARYQSQGINRLFRTDQSGAVVVDFDQSAVHVSQWRQEAPHYWLN